MSDEDTLSLGERLRNGVLNLWQKVNTQEKVLAHHGQEIEAMKAEMRSLKSQVHGLKSSRGKAIAHNARLKAAISEADSKLEQISSALN